MITHLHGLIYAREHGLDTTFEPYVARALAEFALAQAARAQSEPGVEVGRVWMAEQAGRMVGSIAMIRGVERPDEAQLRWFLLEPECRGFGLGRRLIADALAFARDQGWTKIHLWTFADLDAAIALYRRHGFVETTRQTLTQWGRTLTEIRMDADLAR